MNNELTETGWINKEISTSNGNKSLSSYDNTT